MSCADAASWKKCSQATNLQATLEQFLEITDLLLEQVQLNSTHLFRADILYDSNGILETLAEKERKGAGPGIAYDSESEQEALREAHAAPVFEGYSNYRTVLRRLIPRKPQLDKSLEQSCFLYSDALEDSDTKAALVCYVPHCSSDSMPWYHPKVRALSYLFKATPTTATISVYCLPFSDTATPLPDRLQRIFQSLLNTLVRLLKLPSKPQQERLKNINSNLDPLTVSLTASALKDTILPQHTVQNTYTRLKETYASDLISRWVEKTEPAKHVFEDLSIAAFLIELWKTMYWNFTFPGFVDIACGNGVLTYILVKEGWHGKGFDARRRKTWDVLGIEQHLEEKVCIPRPFLDAADDAVLAGLNVLDGCFKERTFIISNHADELTCWTPLLAVLSCSENPLPFLAIPCCSHALDGSRKRYTLKDITAGVHNLEVSTNTNATQEESQEATAEKGDLRALKASRNNTDNSMYACLTRKIAALAQELGLDVELTLMRIPSTRNIGIVGNRKRAGRYHHGATDAYRNECRTIDDVDFVSQEHGTIANDDYSHLYQLCAILERECATTEGLQTSARTWVAKATKLQGGKGRGKVNWKTSVAVDGAQPGHCV